jgi:aminoglycoside/choline kinase family phosphotransferase
MLQTALNVVRQRELRCSGARRSLPCSSSAFAKAAQHMPDTIPHLSALLDTLYKTHASGTLQALRGGISTRRYRRFQPDPALATGPVSLIVMQLPDEPSDGPAREQAQAFIDVQHWLHANGIAVPALYLHDLPHGLMLLEDLGEETFEARLHGEPHAAWSQHYATAIDLLARMHSAAAREYDSSACIALRKFYQPSLLRSELDHFREWGIEALQGQLMAAEREELDAHFDALTSALVALPRGFVHRDYQSRNLMWAPDGRLVVIDFQDAFMGPAAYDLVALLCDSYVVIDRELQSAMLQRYAAQRAFSAAESAELQRGFALCAVQRKLKDAGRFVYVDRVRQLPDFLAFYPGSLVYVARELASLPDFAKLTALLARCVPNWPQL